MTTRRAACSCGQLFLETEGDPVRISVCHCLACKQRTGSAFGAQARFRNEQVRGPSGRYSEFKRKGDSGGTATFRFCPDCGATLCWRADALPEFVTVAMGAFADPHFPAPTISVYEARAHDWARVPAGPGIERWD